MRYIARDALEFFLFHALPVVFGCAIAKNLITSQALMELERVDDHVALGELAVGLIKGGDGLQPRVRALIRWPSSISRFKAGIS